MLFAENDTGVRTALALLPRRLAGRIEQAAEQSILEEIRLRAARPVQLITASGEQLIESALFTVQEAELLLETLERLFSLLQSVVHCLPAGACFLCDL